MRNAHRGANTATGAKAKKIKSPRRTDPQAFVEHREIDQVSQPRPLRIKDTFLPTCPRLCPIKESDRKYGWPLGQRPDDHPGLSELGL